MVRTSLSIEKLPMGRMRMGVDTPTQVTEVCDSIRTPTDLPSVPAVTEMTTQTNVGWSLMAVNRGEPTKSRTWVPPPGFPQPGRA